MSLFRRMTGRTAKRFYASVAVFAMAGWLLVIGRPMAEAQIGEYQRQQRDAEVAGPCQNGLIIAMTAAESRGKAIAATNGQKAIGATLLDIQASETELLADVEKLECPSYRQEAQADFIGAQRAFLTVFDLMLDGRAPWSDDELGKRIGFARVMLNTFLDTARPAQQGAPR